MEQGNCTGKGGGGREVETFKGFDLNDINYFIVWVYFVIYCKQEVEGYNDCNNNTS